MNDTIAAQATAAGEGGVAIVRLSGAQSAPILSRVFRAKNGAALEDRVLTFGAIIDGDQVVDEAMAVLMRGPRSYTREDVAEIHCHGSQALVRRVLLLLLREGARMAEPGEFTCRAFLGGRIDLAQAEAVMRMVRAGSDRAMRSAVRQMEGGVSAFVRDAREELTALLAALCAATDFPDEIEEEQTAQEILRGCRALRERLVADCDPRAGRIEDEGLRVVLCGRPNAGKSSLLNALLGGERAIVTDVPGTTRDTLTEAIQVDGVKMLLTDTAGLRETGDAVERIGVERARAALEEADVRVLVLDGSGGGRRPLPSPNKAVGKRIAAPEADALNKNDGQCLLDDLHGLAPHVVALTKTDLPARVTAEQVEAAFPEATVVGVCAPRGEGLQRLCKAFLSFAPPDGAESAALSQARHVEAAQRACASLLDAERAIEDGMPLDVCAVDLSAALDALGEITGETMNETVIDEVFSRFCVGK